MKREDLQNKYQEQVESVKKLIGDNKKLAKAVDKLASLRAQLAIEPMNFCIKEDEVLKKIDLGASELGLTESGVYFRTKGGFRIFATPNLGLFQAIKSMIEALEERDKMTNEEKEALDLNIDAFKFVAMIPTLCASDQTFLYNMAAETMKYVQTQTEDSLNLITPSKEDIEKNIQFEQAVQGMENLTGGAEGNGKQEGQNQSEG